MVIRDLTLRSAASFGSFHLIRLLYDEYMFYLVEHRVAQATGETPMGVMGEVKTVLFVELSMSCKEPWSQAFSLIAISLCCSIYRSFRTWIPCHLPTSTKVSSDCKLRPHYTQSYIITVQTNQPRHFRPGGDLVAFLWDEIAGRTLYCLCSSIIRQFLVYRDSSSNIMFSFLADITNPS